MAGLFDDDRVPGSPDVRCIDCAKFGKKTKPPRQLRLANACGGLRLIE